MHPEPGRVRHRPVELVAVLPELRHRRVAADHGHDPLVVVVERRTGLAGEVGKDVLRRPPSRLLRDGPSWGSVEPSSAAMFAASPRTYTPGKPGTVRSGSTSTRPPRPVGSPEASMTPPAFSPPAQTTRWLRILRAVGEDDLPRVDLRDAHTQPELDAVLLEALRRIGVGLVGEAVEHVAALVDDDDLDLVRGDVLVRERISPLAASDSAPAISTPVAPAPTMTKVSAPFSMSVGSRSTASRIPMIRDRRRSAWSTE